MEYMLNFESPDMDRPIIKVFGVGGGGGNAANHMYQLGIKGVEIFICDTDAQRLNNSPIPNKILLGETGRGAGMNPINGRAAAIAKADEIRKVLEHDTSMLFITAGMGGGTGTGASPVVAAIAKELGILTVAIINSPFSFEGRKKKLQAEEGIRELIKYVDSYIIINNQKIFNLPKDIELKKHFAFANDVLTIAAKSISELISIPGEMNLDFEDVKMVMKNSGKALMGSGVGTGENRAKIALEQAISGTLLENNNISGADNVLLNITTGKVELKAKELEDITSRLNEITNNDENLMLGTVDDQTIDEELKITVIVTGFDKPIVKKVSLTNEIISNKIDSAPISSETESNKNIQPETIQNEIKVEAKPVEEIKIRTIPAPTQDLFINQTISTKPAENTHTQPIIIKKEEIKVEEKKELKSEPIEKPRSIFDLFKSSEKRVKEPEVSHINEDTPKIDNSAISIKVSQKIEEEFKLEEEIYIENETNPDDEVCYNTQTNNSFEFVFPLTVEEKDIFDNSETPLDTLVKEEKKQNVSSLEDDRISKLKSKSYQYKSVQTIEELENVPAYVRQNVELSGIVKQKEISSYNLTKDENDKVILKKNNSFLDENVD